MVYGVVCGVLFLFWQNVIIVPFYVSQLHATYVVVKFTVENINKIMLNFMQIATLTVFYSNLEGVG